MAKRKIIELILIMSVSICVAVVVQLGFIVTLSANWPITHLLVIVSGLLIIYSSTRNAIIWTLGSMWFYGAYTLASESAIGFSMAIIVLIIARVYHRWWSAPSLPAIITVSLLITMGYLLVQQVIISPYQSDSLDITTGGTQRMIIFIIVNSTFITVLSLILKKIYSTKIIHKYSYEEIR